MPYTLNFSDPSKTETVVVPDMPPGINTLDTSLSLVGKGYPNYGQKIAQNFLHILENFASALPPENPIEGQLWYDTSDPTNKVLRIMDGTASSVRWPNANGIYQQGTDPRDTSTSGLKTGDIWVDTTNNQLKIFSSDDWTVVGPVIASGGEKTGPESVYIDDISTPPVEYPIIKLWVGGTVVAIVAYNNFTPRVVIDGFTVLYPGINLSSNSTVLNGIADTAKSLTIGTQKFGAEKFLRKDDASAYGQLITGRVLWQTPTNQAGSQGRDGVVITNSATPTSSEYVQLYKFNNDALLLNNTQAGKIILKVKPSVTSGLGSNLVDIITADARSVGVNTATTVATLDVYGSTRILNTLTVTSTENTALDVKGGASIQGNIVTSATIVAYDDVTVKGQLYVDYVDTNGAPILGAGILASNSGTYDIGTASVPFKSIYAQRVGTTATTYYGTLQGSALRLAASTNFKLQGQVTATSFLYNGQSTQAVFTATLHPSAITDQVSATSATSTASMLINEYGNLRQVTKSDFLQDLFPPGMITAYGGNKNLLLPNNGAPTGWLWCDGSSFTVPAASTSTYYNLFQVIQFAYSTGTGLTFNVPNLTNATTASIGAPYTATYIQYIIKI